MGVLHCSNEQMRSAMVAIPLAMVLGALVTPWPLVGAAIGGIVTTIKLIASPIIGRNADPGIQILLRVSVSIISTVVMSVAFIGLGFPLIRDNIDDLILTNAIAMLTGMIAPLCCRC